MRKSRNKNNLGSEVREAKERGMLASCWDGLKKGRAENQRINKAKKKGSEEIRQSVAFLVQGESAIDIPTSRHPHCTHNAGPVATALSSAFGLRPDVHRGHASGPTCAPSVTERIITTCPSEAESTDSNSSDSSGKSSSEGVGGVGLNYCNSTGSGSSHK